MSEFYTSRVKLTHIPKFLPLKSLNCDVIFPNGKQSFSSVTEIAALPVADKAAKVYLVVRIENTVVYKKRLHIYAKDKIRDWHVPIKYTLSTTCATKKTTCTFKLKLNIYEIDKSTNKAVLLDYAQTAALAQQVQKKHKTNIGYFIHRRSGFIARTSKSTIDKINNPSKVQNDYVKKAMELFKAECNRLGQKDFSSLVYRDLMIPLFEHFLANTKKPGSVINDINGVFGENVPESSTTDVYVFYHIYEALIRPTETDPGYDKIQHFTYSAYAQFKYGKWATDVAQYSMEVYDGFSGNSLEDSKSDMHANNLGQAYGLKLVRRYHPVRPVTAP